MKKLIRSVLFFVMLCALAVGIAACSRPMTSPIQLFVNDQNVLTWKKIDAARSYTVRIKNVDTGETNDYSSGKNSYSLSALEEGYYELCVKAIPTDKSYDDSKWSNIITFHKEYETGCVYQLINANREYEIVRFGTASGDLVIEDMHHGKPVTRIADKAFKGCSRLTGVTIGANVTYIGDSAFFNCKNLKFVNMPDGVTYLGTAAFQQCSSLESIRFPAGIDTINDYMCAYCRTLGSVEMGENIKSIGSCVFTACSGLSTIDIPDSVETLGDYAFSNCSGATELNIGKGLKTIDENAFSEMTSLTTINFPQESSLTYIGDSAFSRCQSLASVTLPDGLETLEARAFTGASNLEEVSIPDSVSKVGRDCFSGTKLFNRQNTSENESGFIYADKWVIGVYNDFRAAPTYGEDGTTIISQGMTTINQNSFKAGTYGIADYALCQMFSLRTVTLNTSIKYIGKYSFGSCTMMNKFQTGTNGLKVIGYRAFYQCKMLTNIRLSEGLEEIDDAAFWKCERLAQKAFGDTSDVIPSTVTRIGQDVFWETAVYDEDDTTTRAVYMGNWVVGFVDNSTIGTNITLERNTVGIADYAFNTFQTMNNISGLSNVRYMGKGAFWGCTGLTSISLGHNLREIKDYTFTYCYSLFKVSLPNNLRTIGEAAFLGCNMLNDLDLSETRTESIGRRAFYGCTNLKTLDLNANYRGESTLTEIGDKAFYGCTVLGLDPKYESIDAKQLAEQEGKEEYGEDFTLPASTNVITIPYSVKTIGDRAFYGCLSLENIRFDTNVDDEGNVRGVEYIGVSAFAKDTALKAIKLPDSLKTVMKNAFYRCYDATELDLGSGVEYIGDYAFEGVAASQVALPETLNRIGKYAFRRMVNLESVVIPSTVEVMDTGVFYECKSATLYVENSEIPRTWNVRYNPSYRPVIYSVSLADDKSYVRSMTIGDENVLYANVKEDEKDPQRKGVRGPQRKGYVFLGWSLSEGGQIEYTGTNAADAPIGTTLYSNWEIITYEITYELNEGVNSADNPSTYNVENDTITFAEPTREGYVFRGWFIDEDFKINIKDIRKGSTGNVKVYAKWTEEEVFGGDTGDTGSGENG